MHVLSSLLTLSLLGFGAANANTLSFSIGAGADVTLDEGVRGTTSPFCQKLCKKTNIEERGAKTCKELAEDDCKTVNFYRKNGGELRLCVWQPQWKCTEDWTTACISKRPWNCDTSDSVQETLGLCESLCYKTDVRSLDTNCHKLSPEECSSGQFYESDKVGNRHHCELRSGACFASSVCPVQNATCPGTSVFQRHKPEVAPMVAGNSAECHAMCYKTNVAVAALSCSGLSPAHCSSGQFYESDWHGVRRLCVVKGAECQADLARPCPASLPLCSDASVQASVRRSVHGKGPEAENASPAMPEEIPAFCSSLCEKTNTRSMNVSCRDLPAASCESRGFYETDHDGQRRLCIQQGGECITDLSAACAEHFPICDVAFDGEANNQSTHCFLYCDKINTRSRRKSCQELSDSECLSGLFYESDHKGNRLMCSHSNQGCSANISTTCKAAYPICHGLDDAPVHDTRADGAPAIVRSSKIAVHSGSPAAQAAFGGAAVETYHSAALNWKLSKLFASWLFGNAVMSLVMDLH